MGTVDISTTTAIDNAPASAIPPIYSPRKAVFWSFILNTAFGAYLVSANWKALNEPEKASKSREWLYGSLFVLFLMIAAAIFNARGLGLAHLAWLAFWYAQDGSKQVEYVRKRFGKDYPRKSFTKPLLVVLGIFVAFVACVVVADFFGLLPSGGQ